MIDDRYFLEFADYSRDLDAIRQVRVPVFIVEQNVPEDLEWDEDDLRCDHALARERDGTPIATGRLSPEGKIGRMAVVKHWRGQGVGAAILRSLMERARERGMREVHLHAQLHAQKFYLAAGFRPFGEPFDEAGIPHIAMTRVIAAPESLKSPAKQAQALSLQTEPLQAQTGAELAVIMRTVINDARRELRIFTHVLERTVFDQVETLDALKHFAISHRPRNLLRILVVDPTDAILSGHRLVGLSQQLSSIIAIRVPADDDCAYPSAYCVNEAGGYVLQDSRERPNARGNRADGVEAARLRRHFDLAWEHGTEHTGLRRLGL